jgi:hypothetical protein
VGRRVPGRLYGPHPRMRFWHQSFMPNSARFEMFPPVHFGLRTPPEPSPSPIKEPPSPPESPDAPVREPDPDDPDQI